LQEDLLIEARQDRRQDDGAELFDERGVEILGSRMHGAVDHEEGLGTRLFIFKLKS